MQKRANSSTNKLSISVQCADEGEPPPPQVRALLRAALPQGGEVAVRFVSAAEITRLNQHYRNLAKPTNVLSFSYSDTADKVVGDIAVCVEAAKKTAHTHNMLLQHHLAHLIVHGALHLCGYRHDTAPHAKKMEAAEQQILAKFGIPNPY
ncbi:MAG: rRNA maturation RNase YbeY [Gammaproteobacteria bacterium WSBS_2016_MAG_OTU1]